MKRAILYQASRKPEYFEWARLSAKSAKKQMPDVDTILVTDLSLPKCRWFDTVIRREPVKERDVLLPPLWLLPKERYDSAFYTGADSYICKPLYDVFELVENPKFDIALVHTSGRIRDTNYPSPSVPKAYPYYGGALIAFQDCKKVRKFFDDWRAIFDEHKVKYREQQMRQGPRFCDQGPMRVALYHSDLNVVGLERHYCTKPGAVVVSRWVRLITTPKTKHPEKLAKLVNRHAPHPRYISPKGESTRLT
jgi:hypothetical protein